MFFSGALLHVHLPLLSALLDLDWCGLHGMEQSRDRDHTNDYFAEPCNTYLLGILTGVLAGFAESTQLLLVRKL